MVGGTRFQFRRSAADTYGMTTRDFAKRALSSKIPNGIVPAVLQLDEEQNNSDEGRPMWKVRSDRLDDVVNDPWLVPRKGTGKHGVIYIANY